MRPTPEEKRILSDNHSGSSEILLSAINYIHRYLAKRSYRQQAVNHIAFFLDALADAFPSMAIISNGTVKLKKIITLNKQDLIAERIDSFMHELESADNRTIETCRALFRRKVSVVTYSNSGLVKKVLSHYRKMIKRVYLSESRPACEGRKMAEYFNKLKIPVTFCTDMALPAYFNSADYLLIGADSVGRTHFINKTGSGALLRLAGINKVKRIVVFESLKRRTGAGKVVREPEYDSKTLWPGQLPDNIKTDCHCFESIPLNHADLLISDTGIKSYKISGKKKPGGKPPG
jgi:translation initiation factor 2B subunit (eIF-2B alpha/beta/delta family)